MKRTLLNLTALMALVASVALFGCDSDEGGAGTGGTGNTGGEPGDELPPQVTCSADFCEIAAPINNPITQSFTVKADKPYLLKGGVFIGDDQSETVLTVEPGAQIFGETSSKAFLTIRRGSKIMAEGTKESPIVFTSSKAPGSRARGDWGGIIINGKAPINGCDAGSCEAEGEGGTGLYGGDDPADSSGTLRYVRVEFAGHPITEDNELNGIAFQAVGSGTTIEYIQVHMAADDGIEFFGGTAQWKYVLTTGISDDNLDWTDGWVGKGQFFVAQQYGDAGDNGIEADNNGDNNAATPRSNPMLSNLTLIGSPESDSSDIGLLLREGTGASIHNAVVVGWNDACFDIDHAETYANAYDGTNLTGGLVVAHSILECATNFKLEDEKDGSDNPIPDPWSAEDFFVDWNEGNMTGDAGLADPFNEGSLSAAPASGSAAATGGVTPSDPFFDSVTFRGGVDPSDDWTQGWTTSATN